MRTRYTVAWLFWLISFGVIEWLAIRDARKGDTLSEHVWSWFSVGVRKPLWWLRRSALLGFLIWLVLHFLIQS